MTYPIDQNKSDLLTPPTNAALLNSEPLHHHATRAYIRAMLEESAPPDTPPEAFGPYRDIVTNLPHAYDAGGTPLVRRALNDLLRRRPELAALVSADQSTDEHKGRWTADELLSAQFPPIVWVAPDLLPEGLSFLAGRPRLGKSWLALQIARPVACGGRFFGCTVALRPVLYLALEAGKRRLQSRMRQQEWPASRHAVFYTTWAPLDAGGLEVLCTEMDTMPYRLMVIDTLSRALSMKQDQNGVSDMTVVLGPLQRLALEKGVAILVIDHHTKRRGADPDPIDDILGSTGKGAVADGVMGLYRERGKQTAALRIVGRDLAAESTLALEWDPECGCWQYRGPVAEVIKETLQEKILTAISELGGQATTAQTAEHLGKDKGNINRELTKLLERGQLELGEKIGKEQLYRVPGTRQHETAA
jgi:AAA domain